MSQDGDQVIFGNILQKLTLTMQNVIFVKKVILTKLV